MTYEVAFSPQAEEELDRYIAYLAHDQQVPLTASRWLTKALEATKTLSVFPHRCPPAAENERSPHTIRMLIVDRCLFLYRVDETSRTVRILDFRHGSRLPRPIDRDQ